METAALVSRIIDVDLPSSFTFQNEAFGSRFQGCRSQRIQRVHGQLISGEVLGFVFAASKIHTTWLLFSLFCLSESVFISFSTISARLQFWTHFPDVPRLAADAAFSRSIKAGIAEVVGIAASITTSLLLADFDSLYYGSLVELQ